MHLIGSNPPAEPRAIAVLAEIDGPNVGAWHYIDHDSPNCDILPFAIGGGRAGFASWAEEDVATDQIAVSFWLAPIDEIGDAADPVYQFDGPTDVPTHLFISATNYAYRMSSGQLVLLDDANESTLMNGADFRGIPQNEDLRGGRLVFETWSGGVRLATGTMADGPSILLDVLPMDVQLFATDGVSMAWLQGRDWDGATHRFAELDLWTAPYAETAAELTPRRVLAARAPRITAIEAAPVRSGCPQPRHSSRRDSRRRSGRT